MGKKPFFTKPDPHLYQGRSSDKSNYLKSLVRYTFWLVFLFAFVFGVSFVYFLKKNESHQMINLKGRNVIEAIEWLQERSLRVLISKKIDPQIPRYHVITQNPAPGTTVKENRVVSLTISFGQNNLIMPDYVGKDYNQAYRELLTYLSGYQVIPRITKIEHFTDIGEGLVVDHYPQFEQPINLDDRFIFVVSKGIATNTLKIVDYTYQNYLEIEEDFVSRGIKVSADYLLTKDKNLNGKIFFQNKTNGTILLPGETILFTVGIFSPESSSIAPDSLEVLHSYRLLVPEISTLIDFTNKLFNRDNSVYLSLTNQKTTRSSKLRKVLIRLIDQLDDRILLDDLFSPRKEIILPFKAVGKGRLEVFIDEEIYESFFFD